MRWPPTLPGLVRDLGKEFCALLFSKSGALPCRNQLERQTRSCRHPRFLTAKLPPAPLLLPQPPRIVRLPPTPLGRQNPLFPRLLLLAPFQILKQFPPPLELPPPPLKPAFHDPDLDSRGQSGRLREEVSGVGAAGLGAHAVQDDEVQRGHARGDVSRDGRVAGLGLSSRLGSVPWKNRIERRGGATGTDRRCSDPNSRVVKLRAPGIFPPAKSLLRTSGAMRV